MPRVLGGWAFSCERGNPVGLYGDPRGVDVFRGEVLLQVTQAPPLILRASVPRPYTRSTLGTPQDPTVQALAYLES